MSGEGAPPATGVRAGLEEAERRRRAAARASSGLRTPSHRAVWALALLAAGVAFGRLAVPVAGVQLSSWMALIAGALCSALGVVARGRWARAWLAIGIFCAGVGWFTLRVGERPADDLSRLLGERPSLMTVEGMVESSARVMGTQRGALVGFARNDRRVARFELRVAGVVGADGSVTPASGRLSVRVDGPVAGARAEAGSFAQALPGAGARVRVTGLATSVRGPSNPGEADFRPVAADRGIVGSIRCASAPLVEAIERPRSPMARARAAWLAWRDRMRGAARAVLSRAIGPEHSRREALLGALLLGERGGAYDELSAPFVRLGVSHVLAISGLHVGIFAGFIAMLVRLTGDRWRAEALAVLLAIALMMVLIPARAPVVRAWAIIGGFAVAGLFGRRYDSMSTLAWIACAVLIWRPTELWNPGFQLSFLIVGALIALTGPMRERIFGLKRDPDHRTAWERARYRGEDALCASTCAWLVSLPLVMHHFGVVTVFAPLVSLVVIPIVGALLVAGYAIIAAAWVAPGASGVLGPALDWMSGWLLGLVAAIDGAPGATLRVPATGWVWTTGASVGIWLVLLRGLGRGRVRRIVAIGALIGLASWPAYLIAGGAPGLSGRETSWLPSGDVVLRWDAIDVGDGSAHILRSDGHAVMFDCGSNWYGIGERTIPNAARALGAWRIPTVIISHPDLDHYSGLLDSIEPLGVRRVLIGRALADEADRVPGGPSAFLLAELGRRRVQVRTVGAGDTLDFGRARLEFLAPPPDFAWEKDNDASLVALVTVLAPNSAPSPTNHGSRAHEPRPFRLLLCGDIEQHAMDEVEAALAQRGIDRVDAMEAPHHGSARPFAFAFVEGLSPRLVVQSTGVSRLGDERWDDVKASVDRWLITARDGGVSAAISPDGTITTRTWKQE